MEARWREAPFIRSRVRVSGMMATKYLIFITFFRDLAFSSSCGHKRSNGSVST
jgi:hypothetical protein